MRLILLLLRRSPAAVVVAIVAGVASGACNAALLALINTVLQRAAGGEVPLRLGGAFLGLALLVPVTGVASSYMISALGQRAVLDMRLLLTRRIFDAPLRGLEGVGTHRLLTALTQDLGAVVAALVRLPTFFTNLAIVMGCLVYLGWLSLPALLLSTALLAAAVVTYKLITARGKHIYRAARDETDRLWKHFRAATEGIKELKLHSQRKTDFLDGMAATGERMRRLNLRAAVVFQVAAGWGHLVVFLAIGAVLFLLPGRGEVDLRTLIGYSMILLYMVGPLTTLMDAIPTLSSATVAFDNVHRLGLSLDGEPAAGLPGRGTAALPAAGWERLELEGVTHSYHRENEEHPFTLGPIDLRIHPGELIFLVGGNGSGKTTLAKLLVGLYHPESGQVKVDGEAVTDDNRETYLQRFSVVFSDFYLFDAFLGIHTPQLDERVQEHLDRLGLSQRVRVEDGRLSTLKLSQGQRKRLALLTAYLEDRPVYLFDEWAADQDPHFKEIFYREILPGLRARGKTVVVISHDDHYYGLADRVLKLDFGRLEYDGPPAGLRYGAGTAGARPELSVTLA
jgi:putative ATP-binding cassette transporter